VAWKCGRVVRHPSVVAALKIYFLTRSMQVGGTQRQMCLLSRELCRRGHEVSALLFYLGEPLDADLEAAGVRLINLRKRGRWRNFSFLIRLIRIVRAERPDVVYAYLPVPNLLALLLGYVGGGTAIACGVRASDMTSGKHDWLSQLALRLERRLVRRADAVIVNSRAGEQHLCRGARLHNVVVIDNGIDTESYSFDERGRRQMRGAWGVGQDTPVVGCVARLDPMKGHPTLLRGFALLRETHPDARLMCVGTVNEPYASQLRELAHELGIGTAVSWVEHEAGMRDLYSAVDVVCLSSNSEGFPNVLAEAMACGVPCVATDVGDASRILSTADFLIPPADPQSLARALADALSQGRAFSEARAKKIRTEFSPTALADKTEVALTAALQRRQARVYCSAANAK
jgi:glycosyltransferase involved in cell wall biosynthesis